MDKYKEIRVEGKEIVRIIAEAYGIPTDHVWLYYSRRQKDGVFALIRVKDDEQ